MVVTYRKYSFNGVLASVGGILVIVSFVCHYLVQLLVSDFVKLKIIDKLFFRKKRSDEFNDYRIV